MTAKPAQLLGKLVLLLFLSQQLLAAAAVAGVIADVHDADAVATVAEESCHTAVSADTVADDQPAGPHQSQDCESECGNCMGCFLFMPASRLPVAEEHTRLPSVLLEELAPVIPAPENPFRPPIYR